MNFWNKIQPIARTYVLRILIERTLVIFFIPFWVSEI